MLCANVGFLMLLWGGTAFGQSAAAKGSIGGTVIDPQGSAVAGAHTIVRNADFTSSRDLVTNENGTYNATMLTPPIPSR